MKTIFIEEIDSKKIWEVEVEEFFYRTNSSPYARRVMSTGLLKAG